MNTANAFNTLPRPISVRPNSNYTLQLTFDNGEIDMAPESLYLESLPVHLNPQAVP
jgi:hypothetical protein